MAAALEASESNARALTEQLSTSAAQIAQMASDLRSKDEEIAVLAGERDKRHSQGTQVILAIKRLEADLEQAVEENQGHAHEVARMRAQRDEDRESTIRTKQDNQQARLELARLTALCSESAKVHSDQLEHLQQHHERQVRTLLAYIRYVKTCLVRETDRRNDVAWAKNWVAMQLAQVQKQDQVTESALAGALAGESGCSSSSVSSGSASEGPVSEKPCRPTTTTTTTGACVAPRAQTRGRVQLRTAVRAVWSMVRMRRMASNWAHTRQFGQAVREALQAQRGGDPTGHAQKEAAASAASAVIVVPQHPDHHRPRPPPNDKAPETSEAVAVRASSGSSAFSSSASSGGPVMGHHPQQQQLGLVGVQASS